VRRAPWLQGARIDTLIASICLHGEQVYLPVYVLPDQVLRTSLVVANTTALLPVIDRETLGPQDVLIVELPPALAVQKLRSVHEGLKTSPPIFPSSYGRCSSWGLLAAEARLHYRVLVKALPLAAGGAARSLYIYFDKSIHGIAPVGARPAPISIMEEIAGLLGLRTRDPVQLVKKLHEVINSKAYEFVTGCFSEKRYGFLVDLARARIVATAEKPWEGERLAKRARVEPDLVYIDGGSGVPPRYYRFSLRLIEDSDLGSITKTLYIGGHVYLASLDIRARALYGSAKLNIVIEYRSLDNLGNVVATRSESYTLGLSSITSETIIQLDPDYYSYQNITITMWSSSPVHVDIAALEFYKTWGSDADKLTVEGLEVLAHSADPQVSIATRYAEITGPRLVLSPGNDWSATIDSKDMNGALYDYSDNTYPVLSLVLELKNSNPAALTGSQLRVYIDGVLRRTIRITSEEIRYDLGAVVAKATIPLSPESLAHGPLITIKLEGSSTETQLLMDAVIRYKYIPEAWSPQSALNWLGEPTPWLKTVYYHYNPVGSPYRVEYESAVVVEQPVFRVGDQRIIRVDYSESVQKDSTLAIRDMGFHLMIPSNFIAIDLPKAYTRSKGGIRTHSSDIGLVSTIWGLLSSGIELVEQTGIVAVPGPVSAGIAVTDITTYILQGAYGSAACRLETSNYHYNGGTYNEYWCWYSPGFFDNYKALDLIGSFYVRAPSTPGEYRGYILFYSGNDASKPIPFNILVEALSVAGSEPPYYCCYRNTEVLHG